ncbi:MAG: TonB-dependent receptor [Bacteroidales bacterium]|nr:TonB-dependent receptor [Bacteroidales bacterium]
MIRRINFLIIILLIASLSSLAQNSFIRGKIIDNETGETLIGVTVKVVGTNTGTISDFDGNYSLSLNPGVYSIRVSYISYQSQTRTDIEVKEGDVTIANFNLDEEITQLNEVVVTAKAVRYTEASLQLMQKKSASMLDGISAKQITRLGDNDAASALKRVTGVSVQDDKYVFVRGLGDRYTKITLNGADIPALDPEKNTVQMDIFPSNIIENIIVRKTFTPDMPGESTGGHIDITTKDFPEKFTMQFSASFGFNPQANLNKDFLTYEGGNTDWLGMDDGTRDIPCIAKEYLDSYGYINYVPKPPFTDEVLHEISSSFNKTMTPETKRSFLDQSYKFSAGNQINFLKKTLGYNAAISYSSAYKYYDNGVYGIYEEGVQPDPFKIFDKVIYGAQNVNISGLLNLNLKLNSNNKIGVRYLRNQSGKKLAISRSGFFYYEDSPDEDRVLAFLERIFDNYQLHGKHVFPKLNKMVSKWLFSYTYMTQNEPDLRFFEFLLLNDSTMRIKTNDAPARFYREMNEENYNANLNFELPLTILEAQSKIKFGGAYTYKDRNLDETKFEVQSSVSFFSTTDIYTFLTDNIISTTNPFGYYYVADHEQDLNNSYKAHQEVIAGYAMIDLPISGKLRAIAGLRLETSDIEVTNKVVDINDSKYKHGKVKEIDLLPSVNFIYSLTEDMNVRLAGTRTIARPTFREIGTNYYDYKTGIFITGNPLLKRSIITNADIRWEWFIKPGEKISFGGFYKFFKDPIEQKLSITTQNYEIKYINTKDAYLYGIEIEFRKKLDFINVLKNFTFGGNFTAIKSVVKLTEREYNDVLSGDSTRSNKRPMFGQAPYIINAFLNYANKKNGFESNIGFNINGEKLLIITKGATPYIFERPFPSLSFNISKGFGSNRNFIVEIGINNILDAEYKAVHHFKKPVKEDKTYLSYSYGRTFKLRLKYKF